MSFCVEASACGLWPSVNDSQVTPKVCMDDAWSTAKQTALSVEASALSLPSGRPTARRDPRTTRCVCRCSK
eukprot:scaffold149520_cov35-Tisochrysis_lutea.AAC.3